jgi:single-strand DNA-binding protein
VVNGDPSQDLAQLRDVAAVFKGGARVATNHTRKGEKRASFWSVVAFGKRAEILAAHLKRGARVAITGPVSQDQWTNREGQKTMTVEIVAEQVTIIDWPETLTISGEPEPIDEAIPF